MSRTSTNPTPPTDVPPGVPEEELLLEGDLPDWAQELPRRRRFFSRRNIIIAVFALLVLSVLVWLNFPFIRIR